VQQLDNKVVGIIDARCNHEVRHIYFCVRAPDTRITKTDLEI